MEKKLDSKESSITYESLIRKIDEKIAQLEKEEGKQKRDTESSVKNSMTKKEFEKRLGEKIAQLEKEENSNK